MWSVIQQRPQNKIPDIPRITPKEIIYELGIPNITVIIAALS